MSILVTGATGTVGSLVTQGLADAGAQVKALIRQHGKRPFPAGVTEVVADLTDVASMRAALASVRTLFLLNAVTPDEVTQALIALNLAKEAGVERIVYLSVIHADTYTNVPHFTGKHTVERMIESLEIPATILRPAYFMQNEGMVQQTITDYNVYPMPIGAQGIAMIDARDIADIAVVELLRRDRADGPLPRVTLELVGPRALTGTDVAKVWGAALGREIAYAGDDVAAFEAQLAKYGPSWLAYDMRLMMSGIQRFGMHAAEGTVAKLQAILGRPLRTYEGFVREATAKA
ncbi:NmrA family NAD(P)-binding protein [Xanthomonas citri]|uniref:NmrA family NAD(P)-binding protein n=1 Tax=Xanthomonas citri TaxID=346 RepID=UPI000247D09A|nr:NmrA family NAD(P)-binding protein [Xanthomonas citri]MBE0316903.1 NmrA family NAD(P)-binding protein [Xanthomonas citri pv. punicae]MDS0759608.1 NmrA family NAD(P)-binding protein [Xanthomonas citri pv. punicae]MDS0763384.1 NmrA family NAD(P)-binding protein [Xanthomonas citri pv. punicae]MDS0798155.1 NmrA family NAD(P)-binding protein [Xanthomonas citri pv. punicae]MDS0830785.1 NmrA family NAD(P)-binding protein [Xanthomonas citri pv. punicae]